MKSTKVASRYAKALLELAIDQQNVEEVSSNMRYLSDVNEQVADFQILLNSPIINSAKKIAIFGKLFPDFNQTSTSFINLITTNKRENLLAEIASSYEAQLKAYKGITPVTIISAAPLNEATRTSILTKIKASVNGELEVTELIDEKLIGGFIIRMNDQQIDTSIANQFNNLKQRLTR